MKRWTCFPTGEQAITLMIEDKINVKNYQFLLEIQSWLHLFPFPGFQESLLTYHTLTLFYDLEIVVKKCSKGQKTMDWVQDYLQKNFLPNVRASAKGYRRWKIPVCYEKEFAPDLEWVAEKARLPRNEVIRLHCLPVYKVFMIGFMPGFPYMGFVDEKIECPRKSKVQAKVKAGSVGIAGLQTGIYPLDSPGGWQIIGRCPVQIFDLFREPPSLFSTGDEVKFYPIERESFEAMENSPENLILTDVHSC